MKKKDIIIILLFIALIVSGVGIIEFQIPPVFSPFTGTTYTRATSSGPRTIELVDALDQASNDVLEQVVETLFFWDLANPELPRINLLAYSYYFADTTHLQIRLREGILFHDGTPFNAQAAKWNMDRLLYLTNCSGTNTGAIAQTQFLWMFSDEVTPIIHDVEVVGNFNITITLNGAYAPILSALAYINAGMISPTAHAADVHKFIDLTTGTIVGTGPFKYVSYTPNLEVRFSRWEEYWQRPANFQRVIYVIYNDVITAHNAYLGGTIDENAMYSSQHLTTYEIDTNFTVKQFTDDTGKASLVYQYICINNNKFNLTWRKVFAFAINYTYCYQVLRQGNAIRALSPISPGFGETYNSSIIPGVGGIPPNDGDIATARAIMVSMGFGGMGWNDSQWIAVAEGNTPFRSVGFYFMTGNQYREDLFVALSTWFSLIGVSLHQDEPCDPWWDPNCPFYTWPPDYDDLDLFPIGWGPDYLDPFDMLNPLVNPISLSNAAQINDTTLNTMMALVLSATDDTARNNLYKDIQYYIASHFFHIPIYHPKVTVTHRASIHGYPYNAMGSTRIYPQWRGLYPPF
jgi:peptide/nickel transport system substrate-binding protein